MCKDQETRPSARRIGEEEKEMPAWLGKVGRALASAWAVLGALSCAAPPALNEIPKDALVVDVRTAPEFSQGHFLGAVNIPLGDLKGRAGELGDKSRGIVVYCRSGHRSAAAKKLLDAEGFTNVTDGGPLDAMMRLAPKNP
jgi:phage shock protein E